MQLKQSIQLVNETLNSIWKAFIHNSSDFNSLWDTENYDFMIYSFLHARYEDCR